MQKPTPIGSRHIHSGRIIDVSTERLRYGNGREYDLDFVRHRARQVARELSNLLPLLEPDPQTPAAVRRRPPTIP